jgi:hypothetical protein
MVTLNTRFNTGLIGNVCYFNMTDLSSLHCCGHFVLKEAANFVNYVIFKYKIAFYYLKYKNHHFYYWCDRHIITINRHTLKSKSRVSNQGEKCIYKQYDDLPRRRYRILGFLDFWTIVTYMYNLLVNNVLTRHRKQRIKIWLANCIPYICRMFLHNILFI